MRLSAPETLLLFPTVLHVTRYREEQDLNFALKNTIDSLRRTTLGTPPVEFGCTMFSTMVTESSLHKRDDLSDLVKFILNEVSSFADVMDYDAPNVAISKCWLNILGPGDSCDLHNDINGCVSGVYFVNSKATEGARLQIHAPLGNEMIVIKKSKVSDLNVTEIFFDGEPGDLLLFPSHLMRSWTLNKSIREQQMFLFTATIS